MRSFAYFMRFSKVGVERAQSCNGFRTVRSGLLCRPARRESLELTDDLKELHRIGLRQWSDRKATLLRLVLRSHVPLLLQAMQCAARWSPAQSEPVSDVAFDDATPGRKATVHDELAQLVIRPVDAFTTGARPIQGH